MMSRPHRFARAACRHQPCPFPPQVQHHAMKEDMEAQMSRVARGLEMERPLITYFKSAAIDAALAGNIDTLSSNPLDTMKSMRYEVHQTFPTRPGLAQPV